VLQTQKGTRLEMAIVLASFLIGNGYDAFVVCGWFNGIMPSADFTNTVYPVDEAVKTSGKERLLISCYQLESHV
jgi:hypothetical protein